jgi:hypothetical protein
VLNGQTTKSCAFRNFVVPYSRKSTTNQVTIDGHITLTIRTGDMCSSSFLYHSCRVQLECENVGRRMNISTYLFSNVFDELNCAPCGDAHDSTNITVVDSYVLDMMHNVLLTLITKPLNVK